MPEIVLQPKQEAALALIEEGFSSWVGAGGGRGGAKSGGMQRIMLTRRTSLPGTVGAMLMRNYDQVKRYHIDVMLRDFPELTPYYRQGDKKIVIPVGQDERGNPVNSEIHFVYAETLADVIRVFRSANYYDVFVDQAEQFTEAELREIKQAVRWPRTKMGACKLFLAFNMGGVGIDFLRRVFHLKEYFGAEREEDFSFVHVFPWDNVEWTRVALITDLLALEGKTYDDFEALTPEEQVSYNARAERMYYEEFTESERIEYCATRGDYGRNLVSQDEALRKRDWLGSWESLEGAYFGRVFDRDQAVVTQEQVAQLIKPWWKRWLSQDWGRSHYCTTHWHARGDISPDDAKRILGWEIPKPVTICVTYREYIAGGAAESKDEGGERELSEIDIAAQIVKRTPESEREMLRKFFLSPDAFAKRSSANTIAMELGDVLSKHDLPRPETADNDRIGGWSLMYNLLLGSKRKGLEGEAWLISANCPEVIRTIPLLMRDPKNLDDVLKTDKGTAKLEQDIADDVRYGLKTMLSPNSKPQAVVLQEVLAAQPNNTARHMAHLKFTHEKKKSKAFYLPRR